MDQGDLQDDISGLWLKIQGWFNGFVDLLPNLFAAALLLVLTWAVARSLEYATRRAIRYRGRPALAVVGAAVVRWAVLIVGFLLAATIVLPSLKPGDLLSGLGIGSVAIGFAFKDILQNLLSGVLILLRQPFRIGDQIEVAGYEGTVEDIETRATFIKTYDGRRVIIPNATIYTGNVTVNTAYEVRRSEYDVGIGCADDWDRAIQIMVAAANECEGVLREPRTEAFPYGIDAYQNTIRLRWWTAPERTSVVHVKGRVIGAVQRALLKAGIDMPFPTEVHLIHDQTEETDGDRRLQREGWPAGEGDVPRPARIALAEAAREEVERVEARREKEKE
ncbi:mechanosensitive ion channel family protein [Paracoccus jeotgali]|uniref:mechanosensitive ion channel family protein n=1 Tax=Paracoccus jeotgali TaxID=2065379 RepID=UPI0028B08048|nr:mechanosensitive ion channel family protein [Paracoccus jeotgali]